MGLNSAWQPCQTDANLIGNIILLPTSLKTRIGISYKMCVSNVPTLILNCCKCQKHYKKNTKIRIAFAFRRSRVKAKHVLLKWAVASRTFHHHR